MNRSNRILFIILIISYIFRINLGGFVNQITHVGLRNLQSNSNDKTKPYDKIVVSAWAADVNIKVLTAKEEEKLERLIGVNITDVVATDRAFAVRIANDHNEATSAILQLKSSLPQNAKNRHVVADGNRAAAVWVVWGEYLVPGQSKPGKDFGGMVSEEVLNLILADSKTPKNVIDRDSTTYGHVLFANDICPMKNAFIGILSNKLFCWGDSDSCTGWKEVAGGRSNVDVLKVLCAADGYAAIPILSTSHPKYEAHLSVIGKSTAGGVFPSTEKFSAALKTIGSLEPLQFVGNDNAVALLLQGGKVLAWGDKNFGGEIPDTVEADFVRSLTHNDIGFAGIRQTNKVISWGGFSQTNIPTRITDNQKSEQVKEVQGAGECFIAILTDGTVATWGKGDLLYCVEIGAGLSDLYTPFMSVQERLATGVQNVIINKGAFAAILNNTDSEIVVWGHKAYGGSKTPPNDDKKWWDPNDIRNPIVNSMVASDLAFAFIRADGRGVSWGSGDAGGSWSASNAVRGIESVVAMKNGMASIDRTNGVARWPGSTNGYLTRNRQDEFKLNYNPKYFFRTTEGILLVMGEACSYTSWTAWTECSKKCGTGRRRRTRDFLLPPLNDVCDFKFSEEESCNIQMCPYEQPKADVSQISTGVWVGIAFGVAAFLGIAIYAFFACCKRRKTEVYL